MFQIIELEYKGGETSLIIALPNKIDGIHKLIEKLKNPDALNKAIDAMSTQEVLVYLPKFKIETTTDLVDVLEKVSVIFRTKLMQYTIHLFGVYIFVINYSCN